MAATPLTPLLVLALAVPAAGPANMTRLRSTDPVPVAQRAVASPRAAVSRQDIEARLARFESANAGNPRAMAALRAAGATLARDPGAYVHEGVPDAKAIDALVNAQFSGIGGLAVPTPPPTARGGVQVAVGDINGDGATDASRKSGVRVAVGDVNGDGAAARSGRGGIHVAAGDLNALPAAQREQLQLLVLLQAAQAGQAEVDSLSAMGETQSLRLQMAMDRMSKLMSTLSNVMKKASDTSQSVIQNMK